jgi:hypothetical protein
MKTLFPLFIFGLVANAVGIFVVFAPPAANIFPKHPECSINVFSPDITQKQRAFCREWKKND